MKNQAVLIGFLVLAHLEIFGQPSYLDYHQSIIDTEQLIAEHRYEEALSSFHSIFDSYGFVFLRDYKVAAQLAISVNDEASALRYLKRGIKNGWSLKQIRKNKLIRPLLASIPKIEIDSLITCYHQRINQPFRENVHSMFKADQKMAIKSLIRIGQPAKNRYNEEKFAPHSEKQMARLIEIPKKQGYPGEQLIGNDFYVLTILSHHNSISSNYTKKDTLFPYIRPILTSALEKGQMSPFEFALIENWRIASESNHARASYGFLGPTLDSTTLEPANALRDRTGLRSIELRNSLVEIQAETGIDFYLPGQPWQEGKITVVNNR